MKIFVAGSTGVIGRRISSLLVASGHDVKGMTRTTSKANELRVLGATPVLCDVFDRSLLVEVITEFNPDVVINELTDLPDDPILIRKHASFNNRIRTEGTINLVDAAVACNAKVIAQSVAWDLPGDGGIAVKFLERTVLAAGGVIIRYGQFYGPETYFESEPPPSPRVHIDFAARRTLDYLFAPSGVVIVVDDA